MDLGNRASAPYTSVTLDYIIGEDVTLVSGKTYRLSMQVVVNGTAFDLDNDFPFSTPASPVPVFEFKINRAEKGEENFVFGVDDPPEIGDELIVSMTNLDAVNADASRQLEYIWNRGGNEKSVVDDVFNLSLDKSGKLLFQVYYTDSLQTESALLEYGDAGTGDFGTVPEKLPPPTFRMFLPAALG